MLTGPNQSPGGEVRNPLADLHPAGLTVKLQCRKARASPLALFSATISLKQPFQFSLGCMQGNFQDLPALHVHDRVEHSETNFFEAMDPPFDEDGINALGYLILQFWASFAVLGSTAQETSVRIYR